ncbi:fimbrial biogenesis chaperone, partial [Metapseudomonas boanensis]
AISRPLLKIPAHGKASVDILYQGQGLPVDRESYFLLSVLEVPKQASAKNVIQIALKHNLKLLYRPKLPGTPLAAAESLRWTRASAVGPAQLKVRNDSPYYVTLTEIGLQDEQGNACGTQTEHLMVAPISTFDLSVADCMKPVTTLTYGTIDDGNVAHPHRAHISTR